MRPDLVGGMRIVEQPLMTILGPEREEQYHRKRGWRERLLSWTPWVSEVWGLRGVRDQIPDPNILIAGDTIFCHPAVAAKLRAAAHEAELRKPADQRAPWAFLNNNGA